MRWPKIPFLSLNSSSGKTLTLSLYPQFMRKTLCIVLPETYSAPKGACVPSYLFLPCWTWKWMYEAYSGRAAALTAREQVQIVRRVYISSRHVHLNREKKLTVRQIPHSEVQHLKCLATSKRPQIGPEIDWILLERFQQTSSRCRLRWSMPWKPWCLHFTDLRAIKTT